MTVYTSGIGVIGRDVPRQRRSAHIHSEPQVLCGVIHISAAIEPYAFKIERHVDFVASVGVPAVYPELVVGGIDSLHPNLVDEYIGGKLILVAEVDHHLVLRVQVTHRSHRLAIGEVVYGPCGNFQAQESHNY
jgi:hypothetical protein